MTTYLGFASTSTAAYLDGQAVNVKAPPYNAKGDGTTDDTAAIQAAITAVASGGTIFLPAGTYKVTATLTLDTLQGVTIRGAGASATTLTAGAVSGFDLFRIYGSRDCVFSGFSVSSSSSHPLTCAFTMETKTGTTSTHHTFRDLILNGGNNTGLDKGFKTIAGSGGDNNNDWHLFENISVNNYTTAAWSFEHPQSKLHQLDHCAFVGNFSFSQRGVTTALNGNQGGSFACRNFAGGNNTVADFDLGDANDYILIASGRCEGSSRLLHTGGPSGAAFAVTMQAVSMGVSAANLNADNRAVVYQFHGSFTMTGCDFDGDYSALEIYLNQTGGNVSVVSNTMRSTLTQPFTGTHPNALLLSNTTDRNDGSGVVALPNVVPA